MYKYALCCDDMLLLLRCCRECAANAQPFAIASTERLTCASCARRGSADSPAPASYERAYVRACCARVCMRAMLRCGECDAARGAHSVGLRRISPVTRRRCRCRCVVFGGFVVGLSSVHLKSLPSGISRALDLRTSTQCVKLRCGDRAATATTAQKCTSPHARTYTY